MTFKKQPDSNASELHEDANDWFRKFLEQLELFMVETGRRLGSNSKSTDYQLAAMSAVKLTLLDAGMDDEGLRNLFGRVAIAGDDARQSLQWNPELNKRRFELIDGDIQGILTAAEQIDDPLTTILSSSITVLADGRISSDRFETQRLIRQLDLNSPKLVKWRIMWMRIADLASERDSFLYRQLTGFPDELPNLRRLRPPDNSKPEGIEISWYAKQQRGQLPDAY